MTEQEPIFTFTTPPFGHKNLLQAHFHTLPSTQSHAYAMLEGITHHNPYLLKQTFGKTNLSSHEVLLISADTQTAAFGTHNRSWHAPLGNIYETFLWPLPADKLSLVSYIPQITGLAICETLEFFGIFPQIKWVNDVLYGDGKIAGILCENIPLIPYDLPCNDPQYDNSITNTLVVGIGLNVNMTQQDAKSYFALSPDPLKMPFSSMKMAAHHDFDRQCVADVLHQNIIHHYDMLFNTQNFYGLFYEKINQRLAYKGQSVCYQQHESMPIITGIFQGINEQGQGLLQQANDLIQTIITGRIRPQPLHSGHCG